MNVILPNWPAPTWVEGFTTTRGTGFSRKPFDKGNFADHVGDDIVSVTLNRVRLLQNFNLNPKVTWLNQSHSNRVIELTKPENRHVEADGAWTRKKGVSCIVMTGDCLPLLLCDSAGSLVAALHCGWRGLSDGIIESLIRQIKPHASGPLMAWSGPAIGQRAYEVGKEVYDHFVEQDYMMQQAFQRIAKPGKWLVDLHAIVKIKLFQQGIELIYGGDYCTYSDQKRFYSYRRDKKTGRMATVITLKD